MVLLTTASFAIGLGKAVDEMNTRVWARKGCIGIRRHFNDRSLCNRGRLCPACEEARTRARRKTIARRLDYDLNLAEEEGRKLKVGILTMTLPGKDKDIRYAPLQAQYNYLTARTTLSGHTGWHSMRGLNTMMKEWGVTGGSHNIEFTWNSKKKWWNAHLHSLIVGYDGSLAVPLKETTRWERMWNWAGEEYNKPGQVGNPAEFRYNLEDKVVGNRQNKLLEQFGMGKIYSLDWAEQGELENMVRYSSKVAYLAKPFKAPAEKQKELSDFLIGSGTRNKAPRLGRTIGDWNRNGPESSWAVAEAW